MVERKYPVELRDAIHKFLEVQYCELVTYVRLKSFFKVVFFHFSPLPDHVVSILNCDFIHIRNLKLTQWKAVLCRKCST
jgi:hypothetical protein